MWKFEPLERRDAPAGVLVVPSLPSTPDEENPAVEPPYGKWYNDLVVGFDDREDSGSTASGPSAEPHAPSGPSGAVDQVFATYSERDLNTDGKVDLTDFAFLKATLNGQSIGAT